MLRAFCSIEQDREKICDLLKNEFDIDVLFGKEQIKGSYDLFIIESDLGKLSAIKDADPRAEVILVGHDESEAIEAIRLGASAYLTQPVDTRLFQKAVADIVEIFSVRRMTAELERDLYKKYTFAGLVVSRSTQMLNIFSFIRRIAPYFSTVLVTGETGTGKEIIATALHQLSTPEKPFVVCNCGGLTEHLVESELFGHKRGAFTGAVSDKTGLFEAAGDGCIFLDEIGELPLQFQTHLLRVLENGEFRPVGSSMTKKARCRVVAATNRDLSAEVQRGNFRKDLFYRLTPLTIALPALRERKEDIPLLFRVFLERFSARSDKKIHGISQPAQIALMAHDWPGNLRELGNVIEQAAIMSTKSFISLSDLPAEFTSSVRQEAGPLAPLDEMIKAHIHNALRKYNGNRTVTAKALGISRRALLRKIEKLDIQ